jgi:hypothetical protein
MLTGTGVWSAALRYDDPDAIPGAAAEIEALGYTAVSIPDFGDDVFGALDTLLGATSTITVATGVMNIWLQTPEATNGADHVCLQVMPGLDFQSDAGKARHSPGSDARYGVS